MEVEPSQHNTPEESATSPPNNNNQHVEIRKSSQSTPIPATTASSSSSRVDADLHQAPPEQHATTTSQEESLSTPKPRTILPGYRVHKGWQASGVSMAKCDICNQRTRGTVQKCNDCQLSICYTCCVEGRIDSRHTLDPESVPWDVHIKSKEQRKKPARATTSRRGRGRGRPRRGGRRGTSTPSVVTPTPIRAEMLRSDLLEVSNTHRPSVSPSPLGNSPGPSIHGTSALTHSPLYYPSPSPNTRIGQPQHVLPRISQEYNSHTSRIYQRAPPVMDRPINPHHSDGASAWWTPHNSQPPPREHTRPYEVYTRDQRLPVNPELTIGPPPFREPAPSIGPPASFDTYRQTTLPPIHPHPAYNRPTAQHPPQTPTTSRCPIFEDLRNDLITRIRIAQEDFPTADLDACLRAVISRAWSRSKFKHLRGINEEWAFKTLVAVANATFLILGAPLDNAGRRWLHELEHQLVSANAIRPLRYSFASASSEVS